MFVSWFLLIYGQSTGDTRSVSVTCATGVRELWFGQVCALDYRYAWPRWLHNQARHGLPSTYLGRTRPSALSSSLQLAIVSLTFYPSRVWSNSSVNSQIGYYASLITGQVGQRPIVGMARLCSCSRYDYGTVGERIVFGVCRQLTRQ